MENWLDTLDLSKQEFLKKDEMVDSLMVDYKENLIKEKQDKTTEIKKDVKDRCQKGTISLRCHAYSQDDS